MEATELLQTTDAEVWADEFMRLFGDRPEVIDKGLMIGWFANAMAAQEMAGTKKERRLAGLGDDLWSQLEFLRQMWQHGTRGPLIEEQIERWLAERGL